MAIGAMTPSTSATDIASYRATGLPVGAEHRRRHRRHQRHPGHRRRQPRERHGDGDRHGRQPRRRIDHLPHVVAKGDQTLTGFSYSPATVTFGSAAPTLTAPTGVRTTLSFSATPTNGVHGRTPGAAR